MTTEMPRRRRRGKHDQNEQQPVSLSKKMKKETLYNSSSSSPVVTPTITATATATSSATSTEKASTYKKHFNNKPYKAITSNGSSTSSRNHLFKMETVIKKEPGTTSSEEIEAPDSTPNVNKQALRMQ